MSLDITSEKSGSEAKQDAFDQALLQATQRLTEEILGPEKSARYWPTLQPKLLKNSTRFVLFVKSSAPEVKAGVTHVMVNMKLSPDNLETLLREEGVLTSAGIKVLPLIDVTDGKGGHYVWWAGSLDEEKQTLAQDMFKRFYGRLSAKFKAKNIYVLDPTNSSFRLSVPASYRAEVLRREDQMLLAQYLKADVVLSGRVVIGRQVQDNGNLKLSYDLQLWQAKSGRQIGDVSRAEALSSDLPKVVQAVLEQSDGKVLDELAGRLNEAVTGGNLNLNVVKVSVNGAMSYRQQAEFKRLLGQLREIKVLKERMFEPTRVIFEAETSTTGTELAKVLQKARFPLYTVAVDGAQDDSLALSVRALSSASAQ
ncbi:MAG: hypothetical protein ACXVA9_11195 [Bdellovibrionales bacterium]